MRQFLSLGHPDSAWKVLNSDPEAKNSADYIKYARRIRAHTADRRLRKVIRDAMSGATQGGIFHKPPVSEIEFPNEGAQQSPLGTASAALAPLTDAKHLDAFNKSMEQVRVSYGRAKPPALVEYENVFVDRHGQVWQEDGVTLIAHGKPLPAVTRADVPNIPKAIHGIKDTRGIYHWLVDRVPTFAWLLDGRHDDYAILQSDKSPAFENTTLEMLGLEGRAVPVGEAVFVERMVKARVLFAGMTFWDRVGPVFDLLKVRAAEQAKAHGVLPIDKIYISRSDAKRRKMLNESDVEAALAADGFEILSFSGIPIWHQIFLATSAKEIVAPHGAGLSHLIAAQPGAKVTEVLPISDGNYALRYNYARLSLIRGLSYRAWLEPEPDHTDNWTTNLDGFLAFLRAG
ncbi:glycosyltransferase family 61 protein [Methylobacterium sp. WL19]|uniref:glycosyltransferase family 61 protein n=1 Tax=Methylobacterium sp. WL19 TaxID=2603896 RepID=UPI0011CB4D74|nr:glycosyltransferase family 61 protein [Methylobacterium sp. WL19]TXN26849.1 glycosyltransferase family 61 protein [Methylobacterium sp. WL19]